MSRAGPHKADTHHSHWRATYCPTCRVKMKPYHIHCPYCDTRVWSIWLILAVSAGAAGVFWMVVSLLLT